MILKHLAVIYNQKVDVARVRAYNLVLGAYPRMALVEAALFLERTAEFFPRPAELIRTLHENDCNDGRWERDPSTEKTFWTMFENGLSSTDELTPGQCQQIFGHEPWQPPSTRPEPAGLEEWRALARQVRERVGEAVSRNVGCDLPMIAPIIPSSRTAKMAR